MDLLDPIADVLYKEPKAYKLLLSNELKKGVSFPKAREKALMMYLGNMRRFANILSSPNNILGIEYLKALKKQDSIIQPLTIKRQEAEHNNNMFSSSSRFASGSAIRSACISPDIDHLQKYIPEPSFYLLEDCLKKGNYVKDLSAFDKEILYTLRRMTIADIANLPDVSEGLEYAIKDAANSCNSVVELLTLIDTKRYTRTRLQRILLYAILGITKDDMQLSKKVTPYIRILGFNENGKKIISEASRRNPKLNLITSPKKFMDGSSNKNLKHLLQKDIWASNVYTLGATYRATSAPGYIYTLNGAQSTISNDDYWTGNNSLNYTRYNSMYCGQNGNKTGFWWLASPSASYSRHVCGVNGGNADLNYNGSYTSSGVSPLVSLKSSFIPEVEE